MTDAPILARRPNQLDADSVRELLRATQAEFLRCEAAYNHALNERGKAAYLARARFGLTWPAIGAELDIAANSAQMLSDRYLNAIAEGRTLALPVPPRSRRKDPTA